MAVAVVAVLMLRRARRAARPSRSAATYGSDAGSQTEFGRALGMLLVLTVLMPLIASDTLSLVLDSPVASLLVILAFAIALVSGTIILVRTLPRRSLPRWLLVLVGCGAVVVLLATVVVVTEVGTPADPYTSAPDPCTILADQTIRDLIGEPGPPEGTTRAGERRALHRDPDRRFCVLDSRSLAEGTYGSIWTWSYRFYSTQLRLGPDGTQRAETQYDTEREIISTAHDVRCEELPANPPVAACGAVLPTGLRVLVHRDNLFLTLEWSTGHRETRQATPELLTRIAGDIQSQLDQTREPLPSSTLGGQSRTWVNASPRPGSAPVRLAGQTRPVVSQGRQRAGPVPREVPTPHPRLSGDKQRPTNLQVLKGAEYG